MSGGAGIEQRARELCYRENSAMCEWRCSNQCNAVCPADKDLLRASRELFTEYWQKQGHTPSRLRQPTKFRTVMDQLRAWWRDLRAPRVHGRYIKDNDA